MLKPTTSQQCTACNLAAVQSLRHVSCMYARQSVNIGSIALEAVGSAHNK